MVFHLDNEESGQWLSSELSIVSDGTNGGVLVSDQSSISSQPIDGRQTNNGFILTSNARSALKRAFAKHLKETHSDLQEVYGHEEGQNVEIGLLANAVVLKHKVTRRQAARPKERV